MIISTPDHWHAQPAIEAALAGKDIYLQKPASLTIAEGRVMSDTVRKQKRILQIGSQQRASTPWPQFTAIKAQTFKKYMRTPLVIDGWRIMNKQDMKDNGVKYIEIGVNEVK